MEPIGKRITEESPRLEQLFGSKTRVRLLLLFLKNTDDSYYVRELTRMLNVQINSVRRELENLRRLGIVQILQEGDKAIEHNTGIKEKKYYSLNKNFTLVEELKSLFIKSRNLDEQDYVNILKTIPGIKYLVLTGRLVGIEHPDIKVDLFAVGDFNKDRFEEIIDKFQRRLNTEINYTIMPQKEFEYRREVSDKFIYDILSRKKVVVIDSL